MKILAVGVLGVIAIGVQAGNMDEAKMAIRNGAVGKYTYRIVDDMGNPVPKAVAHVWFSSYGRPQDKADWAVETDTNGIFTVEHRFNEKFSVGIEKKGYYHTQDEINYLKMRELPVKDGKWQPYDNTKTLIMKRIRNPQKMVGATDYVDFKIPKYNLWLGFDFEVNHFVSPYGNGRKADILLRFSQRKAGSDECHISMEISFTNQMYAGAYIMKKDKNSEMKSVYSADTNAVFSQSFEYRYDRPSGSGGFADKLQEDEYLVFRSRTVVDERGRLASAHYGKIYGPWHYVGPRGMSVYGIFFNPRKNDTNLEDAFTANINERKWQ